MNSRSTTKIHSRNLPQKPSPENRTNHDSWQKLNSELIHCELCPRLRAHCRNVAEEKRRSYAEWTYWGRPLANFGDPNARVLILGLAPAAHGGNRTGRMFTGDRSGEWLYRALHATGFATREHSEDIHDGPELRDCAITAAAHCAPPDNKPTPEEIENCRPYLQRTLDALPVRVIVALGGIAWKTALDELARRHWWQGRPRPVFTHGAEVQLQDGRWLIGSYHPSQQNTFTGKLTRPMLETVFRQARTRLEERGPV